MSKEIKIENNEISVIEIKSTKENGITVTIWTTEHTKLRDEQKKK